MPQLHDIEQSGVRYRVDREGQVVRLAVEGPPGVELAPRAPHGPHEFVSAALLALKAKQVDDGVHAAVALATRRSAQARPGTDARLEAITAKLSAGAAHEAALVNRLRGDRPVTGGFDLATSLVRAIRAREVDLTPSESSSWYDLHTWSLETLAAPDRAVEAKSLDVDATYTAHLEDLLRVILTTAHGENAKPPALPEPATAVASDVALDLAPRLTVEPLVTHYQRRADSYRYARAVLAATFGEEALGTMHGLRSGVPVSQPLGMELAAMIHLFDGAAAAAMRGLGMPTSWSATMFERWRSGLHDPDIDADIRAMVPIAFDDERGLTKVWMMLGWAERSLRASFARAPRIEVLGEAKGDVVLGTASYPLATPVMAEAHVSRVLDRDAFRALCDRHRTKDAIVAALA